MTDAKAAAPQPQAQDLYGLYDRLDKLEELIEDMAELGVSSVVEAEREIVVLNERIDALEGVASDGATTVEPPDGSVGPA